MAHLCEVEGALAVAVRAVDVGADGDKRLDDLSDLGDIRQGHRRVERRVPGEVGRVQRHHPVS